MEFSETAVDQLDSATDEYRKYLCKIARLIAKKENSNYVTKEHVQKARELICKPN